MTHSQLIELYNQVSKHSNYQVLAEPLRKIIPANTLETRSRFEQERLEYVLDKLSIDSQSVVDIGGNTGFFSLELVRHGARSATLIEGNPDHSLFVSEAAKALGWQDKVTVENRYLNFGDDIRSIKSDLCLLLNVLHHVGDDFGDRSQPIERAKENILTSLSSLARQTRFLVFQLGFNWKGDVSLPLFQHGTKQEMIDFIRAGTSETWNILDIGIAQRDSDGTQYADLDAKNIERMDALGEFLNRPLFIMESKAFHDSRP